MNLGVQVAKTMSLPILSSSRKSSGDAVSDKFPAGLRVLVVDDDPTCLMILEKMLRTCLYEVTKSNRAEKALSLLRENRNGYDIIISDVHMPDMDGFKLLEHVGLEMDLPVIMMSADDSKSVVMKGVTHGACDYLIKPVRIEALKTIWQHVVRRKRHEWKDVEQSKSVEEGERQQNANEDGDYSSSANEGNNWRNPKRRKEEEDEAEDKDDSSALKKPRVVWSVELHQQFMQAVDQLGVDKAVPKKILELMNVPGLTRENVASHLQKYRLYLRRLSGVSQHQAGFVNSFMGHENAGFGSMSSMNGLDLQTLAASGHLPAQSLATLQAATLARSLPRSSISMPMLDQRNNIFSFENPSKLRFGDGNNSNNGNKQVNLLHGIPTAMESKQFRGMNMQPNPRGRDASSLMVQMNNNNNNNSNNIHISRLSSSPMGQQPSFSTNIASNVRASAYNPVAQLGFSGSQNNIDKGLVQNEASSKESRGFDPSYDVFSDLAQHKTTDNWELQNIGITFESTPHVNVQSNNNNSSLSVQPSVVVNQGYSSSESVLRSRNDIGNAVPNMGNQGFSNISSGLQNRNRNGYGITNGNAIPNMGHQGFSSGQSGMQSRNTSGNGHGTAITNMGQQLNTFMGENSLRVKSEAFPEISSSQNTLFNDQFGQDDLFSALLKQQDGIGPVPNDFGFDGFPQLDNLPV